MLKAEEYTLLVPDRTEGWEWKLYPTNPKMDAGAAGAARAGAVKSQLSGKLSLLKSDAGLEEATFVSHFVLIRFEQLSASLL